MAIDPLSQGGDYTKQIDTDSGHPTEQYSSDHAAWMIPLDQLPATATQTAIADLTTTRQRWTIQTSAKWVHVIYQNTGTTAVDAQFLKFVFGTAQDPLSTAEADARLATANAHIEIGLGIPISASFSDANKCLTVDVISAVAVGAGHTLLTLIAGV